MKTLKSTLYAIIAFVFISSNYQCASSKPLPIEEKGLAVQSAYFSEWYAGIEVGGTGFNIYFPNLSNDQSVVIDSVYFRELKGKLVKGRAVYSAILKHPTKTYANLNKAYKQNKDLDISKGFSTELKPNECIIKYFEDGVVKYQKITNIVERVGTYYKDGPPELVVNHHIKTLTENRGVADVEDDEDY